MNPPPVKKYTLKIGDNLFIDIIAATEDKAVAEAKRLHENEQIAVCKVTEDLSLGVLPLYRISTFCSGDVR